MKCQQIIFKTFLLLSLSLFFTGCGEEKKKKLKQVVYLSQIVVRQEKWVL